MQLGMIGLGRMGANLSRRLMRDGHEVVVYDVNADAVEQLGARGRSGQRRSRSSSSKLEAPRARLDHGAGRLRRRDHREARELMEPGDIIIDGGNSYYSDDIDRAERLRPKGIHYVDVGTSGGVFGLERGFCLMIGGEEKIVKRLDPIFATIAPGIDGAPRTPAPRRRAIHRRAGLPALRAPRRRPLREDGAQRHRVRPHGGVRRGPEHPRESERGQAGAARSTPRPPPCASPSTTGTTSTSPRSPRSGGGARSWPPGCST